MSTLLLLGLATLGLGEGSIPPIGATVDFHLPPEGSGGRIVVVAFLKPGCPLAELYATPLADLADRFRSRGVTFVGVCPDEDHDPDALDRFASEHRLGFPLLANTEAAARLGATRTPEVVVLDDHRRIRYRGRIDDRHALTSRRGEARSHDLADALEDLLAGREVDRPAVEAVGCPIHRADPPARPAGPTYCRDVAPILDRRCVSCHRPGQIGPFSLETYRAASSRAEAIAEAVEDRRMPPWHADPRFGRFANDPRLNDRERATLADWVRAGCPEGDPADLPKAIDRPSGWRIPEPDLVVSMPRPYLVPAQGVVDYQTFEVDPGFREDRWVRAVEVRPGNRRVVHHCNVFLKDPRSRDAANAPGELESYCLAEVTPGSPPLTFPAGMAKRIPAGWRLVFVVHYAPIGTPQIDRTSVGLVFADRAGVRQEVATNLILDPDLRIPPREPSHRIERSRTFENDVLLLSMFPHMHLRGKSFRYEVAYPDGRVETLLNVPRYDFAWQNRYELERPLRLPAGSTLRCLATYDNSSGNPANPDPDALVRAGPQSWEEMFNGYYEVVLADQDLTRPSIRRETLASAVAALGCGAGWLLVARKSRSRRIQT